MANSCPLPPRLQAFPDALPLARKAGPGDAMASANIWEHSRHDRFAPSAEPGPPEARRLAAADFRRSPMELHRGRLLDPSPSPCARSTRRSALTRACSRKCLCPTAAALPFQSRSPGPPAIILPSLSRGGGACAAWWRGGATAPFARRRNVRFAHAPPPPLEVVPLPCKGRGGSRAAGSSTGSGKSPCSPRRSPW